MRTIQIRGFKKPQKGMKMLVDHSMTPVEVARFRYHQLYEAKCIRDAEVSEVSRDYLQELKQFIKQTL
jgi:hypothetical protein